MITVPEFYQGYLALSQEVGILKALDTGTERLSNMVSELTEQDGFLAYADGKWTIKDIVQHISDSERIMCTRALRFARNDKTELPGFEENDYVVAADASKKSFFLLMEEFNAVRKASVCLFKSLDPEQLQHSGMANGHEFTAESQGLIMAGHCLHHLNILEERYLPLL